MHANAAAALLTPATALQLTEAIISKRLENLDFLRRLFDGQALWLDCIALSPGGLAAGSELSPATLAQRTRQWFEFSYAAAELLDVPVLDQFLEAMLALVESHAFRSASLPVQGVKSIISTFSSGRSKTGISPFSVGVTTSSPRPAFVGEGPAASSITSFARAIFSRRPASQSAPAASPAQHTQPIPTAAASASLAAPSRFRAVHDLDYTRVVFALTDVLGFVYRRCMPDPSDEVGTARQARQLLRLDALLKHHFFGCLSREVQAAADAVLDGRLLSTIALVEACDSDSSSPAAPGDYFSPSAQPGGDAVTRAHPPSHENLDSLATLAAMV
jgi:hypothetical protein